MAYINKKDTQGTKPLLTEGELGYDKYTAGGDVGRVYVGTGSENIALAKKAEVDAIDTIVDAVHLERADKWLAAQSVANMLYTDGKLSKVRYNVDTDTDYEVMTYTSEKLSNVAHYTSAVLRGNTALSYTDGKLVSAIYTGV